MGSNFPTMAIPFDYLIVAGGGSGLCTVCLVNKPAHVGAGEGVDWIGGFCLSDGELQGF